MGPGRDRTRELMFWLLQPTYDDIIEAKEVYIQLPFKSYKGELVLHF